MRLCTSCALLLLVALPGGMAFAHDADWETVNLLFEPGFSSAPEAQPADGGRGRAQPGEEWEGTAPVPDPLELTGSYDLREFEVSEEFDTDRAVVEITWDEGTAIAYDLDLYVERLAENGDWVHAASSTDGQSLGDGAAMETAFVDAPLPGTYRTRVHNWASTQVAYHGVITFTSERGGGGGGGGKGKPRATEDRPDIVEGSKLHVIYFVPADAEDQTLDTNGTLEDSVASLNVWLEQVTPGRHLRLDTYIGKQNAPHLDISFVRGQRTVEEYANEGTFSAVTNELEARGWNADPAMKRYLVYFEGPAESENICGTAFLTLGDGFAQWSLVFLGSSPGCGARDFGTPETGPGVSESIAMQELVHNEGVVRPESPHQCWAFTFHVCTAGALAILDELDPERTDIAFPFVTVALRDKLLDRDRDDYYQHAFLHRDLDDSPFWEE